jgi:hypothetical protein
MRNFDSLLGSVDVSLNELPVSRDNQTFPLTLIDSFEFNSFDFCFAYGGSFDCYLSFNCVYHSERAICKPNSEDISLAKRVLNDFRDLRFAERRLNR